MICHSKTQTLKKTSDGFCQEVKRKKIKNLSIIYLSETPSEGGRKRQKRSFLVLTTSDAYLRGVRAVTLVNTGMSEVAETSEGEIPPLAFSTQLFFQTPNHHGNS